MTRAKAPAPKGNRHPATHRANGYHDSSLHRAEDGYTAPTAEDRAVKAALDLLKEHGYGISARCLDCRHPITSATSLARMRGPRCAARAVAE